MSEFKAVKTFKRNLDLTSNAINISHGSALALGDFITNGGKKKLPHKERRLLFTAKHTSELYRVGFIALYSNFENFRYQLLLELFNRYPNAVQHDAEIKLVDILDFKSLAAVRTHYLDRLAIARSQDNTEWIALLDKLYGIKVLTDPKKMKALQIMNAIRNVYMHSGGRVTSRFRDEMKSVIDTRPKHNSSVAKKTDDYYKYLATILYGIYGEFEGYSSKAVETNLDQKKANKQV